MRDIVGVVQELVAALDPVLRVLGIPSESAALHLLAMVVEVQPRHGIGDTTAAGFGSNSYTTARRGPSYPFRERINGDAEPRPNTIETPPGVARFLHDLIAGAYDVKTILDPCAGRGALTKPWIGCEVVSFEIVDGRDFFAFNGLIDCDLVVANPPFNNRRVGDKGHPPTRFLAHVVTVVPRATPIALIAPMGMRLNQRARSMRWRWLRDRAPPITGIISLPLDAFDGVQFHVEILLFNMTKLEPHYFLPDDYLTDL